MLYAFELKLQQRQWRQKIRFATHPKRFLAWHFRCGSCILYPASVPKVLICFADLDTVRVKTRQKQVKQFILAASWRPWHIPTTRGCEAPKQHIDYTDNLVESARPSHQRYPGKQEAGAPSWRLGQIVKPSEPKPYSISGLACIWDNPESKAQYTRRVWRVPRSYSRRRRCRHPQNRCVA